MKVIEVDDLPSVSDGQLGLHWVKLGPEYSHPSSSNHRLGRAPRFSATCRNECSRDSSDGSHVPHPEKSGEIRSKTVMKRGEFAAKLQKIVGGL